MRIFFLGLAIPMLLAATNLDKIPPSCTFSVQDGRGRSIQFVQAGASETSRANISILVLSGNGELQREAYAVASSLVEEGIPVTFILGPSLDPSNSSAAIQVYVRGAAASDGYGAIIGIRNISMVRNEILRMSRAAHDTFFQGRCERISVNHSGAQG